MEFNNIVVDVGSSVVNVMSYTIFCDLGLWANAKASISLRIANNKVVRPEGVVIDILV